MTGDGRWLPAAAALLLAAGLGLALHRATRRLAEAERARRETARQLDRRISEIFSLQEISYILSSSLDPERIAGQVADFATRYLRADGALVALAEPAAGAVSVRAAEGILGPLAGTALDAAAAPEVFRALAGERIEVGTGAADRPIVLGGIGVRTMAAAPLRAQGEALGALLVVKAAPLPFTTEDLWLLSTVTTQAAVVLANSRFVGLVRRAKEEWETTFDALTTGIAVVGPDDRIQRANRALATLARLGDAPATGAEGRGLFPAAAASVDRLLAAARAGEMPAPLLAAVDGGGRTLRFTAAPLHEGEPGGVVLLVEDVTDQQAMETQLIQSEKLAAIGQLVSGVAHELNNPLTSIAGLSEFLLARGHLPEADRGHLQVMHAQAERAGRIVRTLLTFARRGAPERQAVDLNAVVTRTAVLVHHELTLRGITLEEHLSAAPVTVLADPHELQQVLLNLVTNSIHALGAPGAATAPRIELTTCRTASGDAELRVRDNGPGVGPDHRHLLFTPFFSTKEPGQGTGLGLSLSYGIVKSHGGRLAYRAPSGGGAEFVATLPAWTPSPDAAAPAPDAEPPPPAGRAPSQLLLVDDDPATHRIVTAIVAGLGLGVTWARTADEGLALAAGRDFSLVVADGRAARADGTPFAEALASARPELIHRLIVGTDQPGTSPPPAVAGAVVPTLAKPFTPRDLRDLIAARLA